MDKFEASNGVTVKRVGAGIYVEGEAVRLDRLREKLQAGSYGDVTPAMQDALREFFQHERDEELGRWRWPENPDYVVLPRLRGWVCVISESTGLTLDARRGQYVGTEPTLFGAANAYFEAHPERKPWHDATEGEVWVLSTADGETAAYAVMSVRESGVVFEGSERRHRLDASDITAARRIWPESA